jgi:hypothetical protein
MKNFSNSESKKFSQKLNINQKFLKFRLLNCKYKDYKNGFIKNDLNISRSSICKLSPGCWLNDEVKIP